MELFNLKSNKFKSLDVRILCCCLCSFSYGSVFGMFIYQEYESLTCTLSD